MPGPRKLPTASTVATKIYMEGITKLTEAERLFYQQHRQEVNEIVTHLRSVGTGKVQAKIPYDEARSLADAALFQGESLGIGKFIAANGWQFPLFIADRQIGSITVNDKGLAMRLRFPWLK
jgi:hypothetical protein